MKCSQQAVCLVGPAYRMVLNALADFGVCMRVACCYLVFQHPSPPPHTPAYFSSSVLNSESSLKKYLDAGSDVIGYICIGLHFQKTVYVFT